MGSSLRLFLVRHGQVASNRELRYIGRRDEPLTARGVEQAARLGDALAELPLARLLSSPLERTRATAERIAERTGLALETDERLVEQSYGEWEGRSRSELMADAAGREWLGRFERDLSTAPPGGESLLTVQRRMAELVEELETGEDEWVVLVSHVGPIKALLALGLSLSLEQSRRFFLDPATITVIDWRQRPLLRLFNAHGHLGWSEALWMGKSEQPPRRERTSEVGRDHG